MGERLNYCCGEASVMLFSLMIQTAEGCGDPGHGLTSPRYVNALTPVTVIYLQKSLHSAAT